MYFFGKICIFFGKICIIFLFTVDVVRRKAVAIAMKHLQIQSFVTGKFSCFFMTFTTIYIEIDSSTNGDCQVWLVHKKNCSSQNGNLFSFRNKRFMLDEMIPIKRNSSKICHILKHLTWSFLQA